MRGKVRPLVVLAVAGFGLVAPGGARAAGEDSSQTGKSGGEATPPSSSTPGPDDPNGASVVVGRDSTVATPSKDAPQALLTSVKETKETTLPFRQSIFFFDQSISTQTLGVGGVPQTYAPLYEWWFSFRPRWYFTDKIFALARFDYIKTLTNSDVGTTNYREDVFDDAWTALYYETPVTRSENTKVRVGGILRWPLSKVSQADGIYVKAGASARVFHKVPIRGAEASALNDVHFAASVWYEHPFVHTTTPTSSDFAYVREDTEGRSFDDTQIAGTTNVIHQMTSSLRAAVQITPKMDLTLDEILIQKWHYAPTDSQTVPIAGGSTSVPRSSNEEQFTEDTWFTAALTYDVLDELSLTLGYYNLQNYISYQGQHRTLFGSDNIWWSPDARFFFTVTANLDEIYARAVGIKETPTSKAANHTAAHQAILNQLEFESGRTRGF